MLVMIDTAIRVGELLNISLEDLVWEENLPVGIGIRDPKNRKERIANLPPVTSNALNRWLEYLKKHLVSVKWLFPNIYGEQLAIRTLQENITEYGRKAGITGRFTPYVPAYFCQELYHVRRGLAQLARDSGT
jgi:integrase